MGGPAPALDYSQEAKNLWAKLGKYVTFGKKDIDKFT